MEDTFSWLRKDHSASKEDYMVSGPGHFLKASGKALGHFFPEAHCLQRLGRAPQQPVLVQYSRPLTLTVPKLTYMEMFV